MAQQQQQHHQLKATPAKERMSDQKVVMMPSETLEVDELNHDDDALLLVLGHLLDNYSHSHTDDDRLRYNYDESSDFNNINAIPDNCCWEVPSSSTFHELIYSEISTQQRHSSTNIETIMAIRGGGNTAIATDDQRSENNDDRDVDHSDAELFNCLEGSASFDLNTDTTTVAAAAAAFTGDPRSEECCDHSALFHDLEGSALFNVNADSRATTTTTNDQNPREYYEDSELFNYLEGSADFNLNADSWANTDDHVHNLGFNNLKADTRTTATEDKKVKDHCDDDSELVNYLEGSGLLDFDSDSLVLQADSTTYATPHFLEQRDNEGKASSQQLREYTLREWIRNSKPEIDSSNSTTALPSVQPRKLSIKYIKSAVVIALKLTESILEAEKDEQMGHMNPIPLASIAPENVLIRARRRGGGRDRVTSGGEAETTTTSTEEEEAAPDEMIEFVWVMSFVGDNLETGTIMSRLFAMGKVMYELFSTNELSNAQEEDNSSISQNGRVCMSSMNLGGSDKESSYHRHRPQKRSYRLSKHPADDITPNLIAKLEAVGVPWSLCSLMKNLLDCQHDSFCEDDAYTSFTDLRLDLILMVDQPYCFLDNIIHNRSDVPKLAIYDKLYGRAHEMRKVDELYQCHAKGEKTGAIHGTIISGAAGVGKSTLANYLQMLTKKSNGYFLSAKFEQNQMSLKPLSNLVNMFDSLCEMIFGDSSQTQLMRIEEELTKAIGSESHLHGVLPRLRKLMPSSVLIEASTSNCVDSAVSMRYLFAELLSVISSHSKPITLLMDDVQYADHASLLLVANLLFSTQQTSVFFAICHRDDEASMSGPFHTWLSSISMLSLETIHLESISPDCVNDLISETFHISPRITRPLSSVLYRKTRGNPLFLRQLLNSLTEQGYIHFNMIQHRWAWNLDKIMELEISDSVLALLMEEIQRLPDDMKFGLQVASCIGYHMTESMIKHLSTELGLDLINILRQLSQRGFMIDVDGAKLFRFTHDRIQQAAYESIPYQERRAIHMKFGLALCYHTLNNGDEDEELFFAAVNQINQGGPSAVLEPSQKHVLAELNLKAGRRSIDLSDYNTAFTLFQFGLSFLGEDSWATSYRISLDLHDSLTEVAMILNKPATVEVFAEKVISHARCFDDKLNCLCTSVQALAAAMQIDKSIETSFGILIQFGEELPRGMGDDTLQTDIDQMTYILQSTPDDSIYNIQENNNAKMTGLFHLYLYLAQALHFYQPWLFGSVSLRTMEITMKYGLCAMSPLAFARFGTLSVTIGYVTAGCRLGKLALKLLERKGSSQYKSKVFSFVYDGILWASEPLQSIADSHMQGFKEGQLSGDIIYGMQNLLMAATAGFVAGRSLDAVQKILLEFFSTLQRYGVKLFIKLAMLLLSQIMVLKGGLHMSRISHLENMPNEGEILADASSAPKVFLDGKVYHLTRAFLFRQMDDESLHINISGAVAENYHQLDSTILMGYFFEGLASFLLARRSMLNRSSIADNESSIKLTARGLSVLKRMRCWSEHCCWNWEDKVLLLEAEHMYTLGDYDQASSLYDSAIRSAHDHKFIHGEAIACEVAGMFYHERGMHIKSYPYFVHSVKSYTKWGATAIATRVETFLRNVIRTSNAASAEAGGDATDILDHQLVATLDSTCTSPLVHLFATTSQGCKKKRCEAEV